MAKATMKTTTVRMKTRAITKMKTMTTMIATPMTMLTATAKLLSSKLGRGGKLFRSGTHQFIKRRSN